MNENNNQYKSGQLAQETAKYCIIDSFGNVVRNDIEVDKGKKFPPTSQKNERFIRS